MAKKDPIAKLPKEAKLQVHDIVLVREQIPIFPVSGWNGQSILAAIESHDQGMFTASEQLYYGMTRQSRIGAALEYRAAQVRKYPFNLETPEGAPQNIAIQANCLERHFNKVVSEFDTSEIIKRLIMFGFCIARHTFEVFEGQIIPVIKPWTQSNCYYHQVERVFYVVTENGESVPVIGDPWILFSTGGERPWLNGAMRKLAFPFFEITHATDRWAYFNDTEAAAIKKITTPVLKREQNEVAAAHKAASELRSGDTFLSPEGYNFEFVTAQGRAGAYKSFMDSLQMAYNDVAIVLLGNNLTQEIKGGSHAAANTAEHISLDYIKTDVVAFGHALQQTTMRLWVEKNFHPHFYGETSLVKYAPKPVWDISEPKDQKQIALSSMNYANATKTFSESVGPEILKTLPIDWKEQAKRCGIFLLGEENSKLVTDK